MADIRQSSAVRDIFDRVEAPLSFGGKWNQVDTGFAPLEDDGFDAGVPFGGGYGWSYWTPDTWDGDDAEVWGCRVASAGPTLAWDLLLLDASTVGGSGGASGYLYRHGRTTGGAYTELYRLDHNAPTLLVGHIFGPFVSGDGNTLLRRNGTSVEGWYTNDYITWTLGETAVDTTYTTNLKGGIAVFGHTSGWTCFGGGPRVATRQQIYRILQSTR